MIHFVGAGPGDPELLTVKGLRLLKSADVVIYAGSLVNPELLKSVKSACEVYDSSSMDLQQVLEVMKAAEAGSRATVRLHTGDPCLFGAIREQMDALKELGIACEVVPGVSSFSAAAAALKKEYTLPGVSQTLILTRMEGRTTVPSLEDIPSLASHRASMAIFLSVQMIGELVGRLRLGYPPATPAAVVYKASWPEQKVLRGTLETIADLVAAEGIRKTALVLVGDFLGNDYDLSKLYDPDFSHEYRAARE